MGLRWVKAKRILRRVPREWWACFCSPVFNSGSILTFLAAVVGLALFLQQADTASAERTMSEWVTSAQAFGLALAIWAVVSLLRAPFIVVSKDRAEGEWKKNHFVYRERRLILTEVFASEGGQIQERDLFLPDVEPDSFVKITAESIPHSSVVEFSALPIGFNPNWTPDGRFYATGLGGTFGCRVNAKKEAKIYVRLRADASAVTIRFYCLDFFVGHASEFGQ